MCRVLKEKGNNSNIIVEAEDGKASVSIGRVTIEILGILEKAGYTTEAETLNLRDEWNLEVEDTIGKELAALAMRMKKPVRDQRKTKSEQTVSNTKDKKQPVDVFNLIFGINE